MKTTATIYIDEDLLEAIDTASGDEDRSRSNWISVACAEKLRVRGYLPALADPKVPR